jgi:prophage regulatory protein
MTPRILRIREVASRVGLSRSAIYARIKAGEFPVPIKQGATSGWLEAEVNAYILALAATHGDQK